ncbi:MAG: AI-2E family transporter [Mariniblastus sp.]
MKKKNKRKKKKTPASKKIGSTMDGSVPSDAKSKSKPAGTSANAAVVDESDPPLEVTAAIDSRPKTEPPWESKISRYVSFGLLLGIIVMVGILFYEVMAKFLVPLFLAAILVVVFRPLHRWLLQKMGGREKSAALSTTVLVLLAVLLPIGALFAIAGAEGQAIFQQFNATKVTEGVKQIRTNLSLDMPSQANLTLINRELLKLQDVPALSDSRKDEHASLLYEIELYAKSLAAEQQLEWPEKSGASDRGVSESESSTDAIKAPKEKAATSEWKKFVSGLFIARELNSQLQFKGDPSPEEKKDRLGQSHDYQLQVNDTAEHFAKFKTTLLGGKSKSRWIELANPSSDQMTKYASQFVALLKDKLPQIGGAGLSFAASLLVGTAIMIIAFYFFLLDGPRMIESFKGLSPIDDEHEQELVAEFSKVSRAVVVATLLSALVQGILAGIGFYFCGLDSIILLTVLSAVLAMVPFVGAAAVWIPCSLYLYFFENNLTAAVGLAVYGVAVISMADNLIKPYILHGQSNLHPLFALLSVIGGVAALGPIGILIGPMIVAFLQTLLKILQREMMDMEKWAEDQPSS